MKSRIYGIISALFGVTACYFVSIGKTWDFLALVAVLFAIYEMSEVSRERRP